jgi:hypothetical protein
MTRAQNPNPPPTHAELANHIQRRQQATGKIERGFAGYRAITVNDYMREPTQEEEQELQDRQQRREDGKAKRRVWEGERKELSRENYLKGGQPEGEFEAWWEERLKDRQRADEFLKARDKARRKMKRDGEKRAEWIEREERERREREEREGQAKGEACGPVERQACELRERQAEMYIDEYEYCNDY